MKKKWLSALVALIFAPVLLACQTAEPAETETPTYTAQLTVEFGDRIDQKQVMVESGDSVMDVLEDAYEIEEDAGLITVIDGVSQDPATNTYWMYDVNGELAPTGAEEQLVQENDEIRFYLETFQ
ncbi:DUF4430 domain-containing protein [Streptococcus suis]|nr:DUF4430 domain-containing protein [Streptococcus suis]